MQRGWAAVLLVVAGCSDEPYPRTFFESPSFRYPIAVNESTLFHVEEQRVDRRLAELDLDGGGQRLVSTMTLVNDVAVWGSTVEWIAGRQLVRSSETGMEMVTLPAGNAYHDLVLGPTGTFVTGTAPDAITSTIFFWGPNGLVQLPIEPKQMNAVAADATHVYVVRPPGEVLVRYPIAGGAEEPLAANVIDAVISGDRLVFSTRTVLVERSLVDDSERVLQRRPDDARALLWPLVVADDVVFWGNMRVMDGQIEEFLLPSSTGYLRAVAANTTHVYWVSSKNGKPEKLGDPSDLRLHRAPIRGERPF